MIPTNSSASAAAPQADVENSSSSELSSGQNDSIKMPDDAENADGGLQTSEDIGKKNKIKLNLKKRKDFYIFSCYLSLIFTSIHQQKTFSF